MRKLDVCLGCREDDVSVGALAEDRGRIYFQYDASFLDRGLELSPFRLPLQPGLIEHRDREFGPLPGLFDDSLPDGWGLLLMDRHFRAGGLQPGAITPLDRLAWLGQRTMGALTYHPSSDEDGVDNRRLDLRDMAREATAILAGTTQDVLPRLLRAGGSPGGARPKVLVGLRLDRDEVISGADEPPPGYEPWIVKFAGPADRGDAGPLEYAYALMAAEAGIDLPPTRLFATAGGASFFGVRRFDREGHRRIHVHTFGNLIHSNFRIPSADYADLMKVTSLLTRDQRQVSRAFRRMVFNVAAHNRDDHVKNFAFLLDEYSGEWSLSPAYDLIFSPGPGGEHTMTVAGEGRHPGRPHLLQVGEQAGLSRPEAGRILEEVRAAIDRWPAHAESTGVTRRTITEVAGRLPSLS